jgi:hypothetical protein
MTDLSLTKVRHLCGLAEAGLGAVGAQRRVRAACEHGAQIRSVLISAARLPPPARASGALAACCESCAAPAAPHPASGTEHVTPPLTLRCFVHRLPPSARSIRAAPPPPPRPRTCAWRRRFVRLPDMWGLAPVTHARLSQPRGFKGFAPDEDPSICPFPAGPTRARMEDNPRRAQALVVTESILSTGSSHARAQEIIDFLPGVKHPPTLLQLILDAKSLLVDKGNINPTIRTVYRKIIDILRCIGWNLGWIQCIQGCRSSSGIRCGWCDVSLAH